jgi:hypothetical protein
VLCPPVSIDDLIFVEQKQNFFMVASRLVLYKRDELIVRAFREMPNQELVAVRGGPYRAQSRRQRAPVMALAMGVALETVDAESPIGSPPTASSIAAQRFSHQRRQPLPQSTRSLSPKGLQRQCRALRRTNR